MAMPSFAYIFVSVPNLAWRSSLVQEEKDNTEKITKIKLKSFKKILLFKIDLANVLEKIIKIVYNIIIH